MLDAVQKHPCRVAAYEMAEIRRELNRLGLQRWSVTPPRDRETVTAHGRPQSTPSSWLQAPKILLRPPEPAAPRAGAVLVNANTENPAWMPVAIMPPPAGYSCDERKNLIWRAVPWSRWHHTPGPALLAALADLNIRTADGVISAWLPRARRMEIRLTQGGSLTAGPETLDPEQQYENCRLRACRVVIAGNARGHPSALAVGID